MRREKTIQGADAMRAATVTIERRPNLASAILGVGSLLYAGLCIPAIARRGWPPIDPIWMAMPYLWIMPIALTAIFDHWQFRSRRVGLALYCLFTAFVDSGTLFEMSPRFVNPLGMLVSTLFIGPIHLLIATIVEAVSQALLRPLRVLAPASGSISRLPRMSLLLWLISYSLIAAAIGFPFAYRHWVIEAAREQGRSLAEQDWQEHNAGLFQHRENYELNGARIEEYCDRRTGFELRGAPIYDHGQRLAYNRRIAELLESHGPPLWSVRSNLPSPEQLVDSLAAADFTEITNLPHDVTPSVTVFRQGTVTRWGSTMTARGASVQITSIAGSSSGSLSGGGGGDSLAIATKVFGLMTVGHGPAKVFFKIDKSDPDLVYIRYGDNWVGLFDHNGRLLMSASR